MVGEVAEKKLYDAATRGDLDTFQQLLQGDPYLLDGVSFAGSRNLLHIATIWVQPAIVEEVLKINPQLARNLDSQKSSPLHIAVAEGHTQIATKLSSVAPEMCWRRDCQGMNPIHIAAMNGHIEILEELIRLDPFPAMETVDRGYTVLHMCVKHRRVRALEVLVGKLGDLVYSKNDDGETLLHLAVRYKQVEMLEFLVENTKIQKQSTDSRGRTARDLLKRSPRDTISYKKMQELLSEALSLRIEELELFNKMGEVIMVVVVLIATMAFQAAISPPGGVWQDESSTHKAGEAVMASSHPKIYKDFVRANTTAFVSSLITIFLLVTRVASDNPLILSGVLYSMLVSMASIAVSYGASITVITPNMETQSLSHVIKVVVAVSLGLLGFGLLGTLFTLLLSTFTRKLLRPPPLQTL